MKMLLFRPSVMKMVRKLTDAYVFCSKAVFLGASVTKSFKKLPDGIDLHYLHTVEIAVDGVEMTVRG